MEKTVTESWAKIGQKNEYCLPLSFLTTQTVTEIQQSIKILFHETKCAQSPGERT